MATALSIVALVISGLTALWTIGWSVYTHRRATRPSIVVLGTFALPVGLGFEFGVPSIDVTVTNAGQVPVTISGVAFEIGGQPETLAVLEWATQSPRSLPIELAPGAHWTALVEVARLQGSLVHRYGPSAPRRIRPVATDTARRSYAAERWLEL